MLFIFIPFYNSSSENYRYIGYNLGSGYIISYLKSLNIAAKQFVWFEPIGVEALVRKIIEENIPIIGFTLYDYNYYNTKLICQRLKDIKPNLKIIFGGPSATFSTEFVLNDCKEVDICVRGEGEITTAQIFDYYEGKTDIEDIKGISYRIGEQIFHNESSILEISNSEAELDMFPSPYLTGIIPPQEAVRIGILTARGCINKCTYCNFTLMSNCKVRYHSIDRTIQELKFLDQHLPTSATINIQDDTFTANAYRIKCLSQRIIEENIALNLTCHTRITETTEEVLKDLRAAGFVEIDFGLESAVPRILRTIKKVSYGKKIQDNNFNVEEEFLTRTKTITKLAKELGFETVVNTIVGLPGETLADAEKTVAFTKSLDVDRCSFNYLQIFPGTELFDTHQQYGLRLTHSIFGLPYEMHYAFDVREVELPANSINVTVGQIASRRIIEEIYSHTQNSTYLGYISKIIIGSNLPGYDFFKLLSGKISFSTELIVHVRPEQDLNVIKREIQKYLINNSLPSLTIRFFEQSNSEVKLVSMNGVVTVFKVSSFAEFYRNETEDLANTLLIKVYSEEDFQYFRQFFNKVTKIFREKGYMSTDDFRVKYFQYEGCWGNECLAISGNILYVNGGKISQCEFQTIDNICYFGLNKCDFDILKKETLITEYFKLNAIIRLINDYFAESSGLLNAEYFKEKCRTFYFEMGKLCIKNRIYENLRLIVYNNLPFMVNENTKQIFKVNEYIAEIYEGLCIDPDNLSNYLKSKYDLPYVDIEELIRSAHEKLLKINSAG